MELPSSDSIDEQWGGCRGVESAYEKTNQIGEGTYGQVRNVKELVSLTGILCLSVQPAQGCQCCSILLPRPLLIALSTRACL